MATCFWCESPLPTEREQYGDPQTPECFACHADPDKGNYPANYGFFIGGDPNNFTPDMECSDPDERARHARNCQAWNEGRPLERGGYGLGENAATNQREWESSYANYTARREILR